MSAIFSKRLNFFNMPNQTPTYVVTITYDFPRENMLVEVDGRYISSEAWEMGNPFVQRVIESLVWSLLLPSVKEAVQESQDSNLYEGPIALTEEELVDLRREDYLLSSGDEVKFFRMCLERLVGNRISHFQNLLIKVLRGEVLEG